MSTQIKPLQDQVVVVGAGLAGLMTALQLAPQPCVLISPVPLGQQSSSNLAQGGIAAALGADDSSALHLADTLQAGAGLCDAEAATKILQQADRAIAILENYGVQFDRASDGSHAFGLEAAHQRRRILHMHGDGTGAGLVAALTAAVRRQPSVTVLEGFAAVNLLTDEGSMVGIRLQGPDGSLTDLASRHVVLATGGLGGLYEATTNPTGNIGAGIALAARAGARLADMEFVQFHPTALLAATRPLPLISEAVRGEGARLVNASGDYFMAEIAGRDLAPRDVVARAIAAENRQGQQTFLDARSLGDRFAKRFPAIAQLCRAAGLDPARDLIPVQPATHYHMGGVATTTTGRSSIAGLWAIGEVAATGLHGANRLASNSLLEALVMGIGAAEDIAGMQDNNSRSALPACSASLPGLTDIAEVRRLVSRHLGLLRDADGLQEAIAALLPLSQGQGCKADAAIIGLLMAVAAYRRQESRGAHARTDFPQQHMVAERQFLTLAEALSHAQSVTRQSTFTPSFARSA